MARRFCEICKQPIEPSRVEDLPKSKLCEAHGKEIEDLGGEFMLIGEQETTNKPGSMKKSYGSASAVQVRNAGAFEQLKERYESARSEQGTIRRDRPS